MKTWRDINHNPFKLCYWHSHQRMLLVVCFFSYPADKTCFDSESILLLPRVMFATNRALTFFPFSSYYLNTKQELSVPLYVLLLLMCLMSVLGFFLLSGIQADKYTRRVKKKVKAGWRRASWVIGARIIRITLFVWHFSKHLLHSLNTSHGLKISVHARAYTHIHLHRPAHKCTKIYLNLSSAHVC